MRFCVAFVTVVALMAAVLMPLNIALGQGGNATRVLPATVQRGETFDVTVTFTAPADEFNSIALRDTAPDGWNVTVDAAWCTPNAEFVKATGARASLIWYGPYDKGVDFTVMYKVTVPCDASPGSHSFNLSPYEIFLSYYIGNGSKNWENIMGDCELEAGLTAIAAISHSPANFSSTQSGSNTENKTLEIWNSGCGMLNWSLGDDAAWLSESPTSGSSTGEHDTVVVSVDTTGMSAGDYSANITITAPGVSNSPQTVPVSLHMGGAGLPLQLWLSQYWWVVVVGIVAVALLVYFLRRRAGA